MTDAAREALFDRLIERKHELEKEGRWGGQKPIAAHFGIGEPAVSQWFNRVNPPDPSRYEELAALLGVNPPWLAWGWGPKFPEDGPDDLSNAARRRPETKVDPETGGEQEGNGCGGPGLT